MNTTSQNTSQQPFRALRLHRPLVPIEPYAQREEITLEEVQHCSKIGLLQLRRKNGKTYVVDIPICLYDITPEIDNEIAKLIGIPQPAQIKPAEKLQEQPASVKQEKIVQSIKPGSISELVDKMLKRSEQLRIEEEQAQGEFEAGNGNIEQTSNLPQPTTKLIELINAQLDH